MARTKPSWPSGVARAAHTVARVFEDQGISGAKGRDQRPAFDALLKAAVRREIDMIAVWSSDRLGRSLSHLVEVLQTIRDTGTGLYIQLRRRHHDTRGPGDVRDAGGVRRVRARDDRRAGERRPRPRQERDRPRSALRGPAGCASHEQLEAARAELARGTGIGKTAQRTELGTGTVHKLKREMASA